MNYRVLLGKMSSGVLIPGIDPTALSREIRFSVQTGILKGSALQILNDSVCGKVEHKIRRFLRAY